jgi:hypothetical protein
MEIKAKTVRIVICFAIISGEIVKKREEEDKGT